MKFRLEIDCDNDAFGGPHAQVIRDEEVASILYSLANRLHDEGLRGDETPLHDLNGNLVGRAYFTTED